MEEDVVDENDYQLSVNGECAKNCKQCAVEIKSKKNSFSDEEYNKIIDEYNSIINEWKFELRNDINNHH